jgi:hypothetical protein
MCYIFTLFNITILGEEQENSKGRNAEVCSDEKND